MADDTVKALERIAYLLEAQIRVTMAANGVDPTEFEADDQYQWIENGIRQLNGLGAYRFRTQYLEMDADNVEELEESPDPATAG